MTSTEGFKLGHELIRQSVCFFDGRNPANQLRLVVYLIVDKVLAPSQLVGNGISEPSTVKLEK